MKRGFASISKAKHRKLSSRGGKRKVAKGFALLSPEDRIVIARRGSSARWEKVTRDSDNELQSPV